MNFITGMFLFFLLSFNVSASVKIKVLTSIDKEFLVSPDFSFPELKYFASLGVRMEFESLIDGIKIKRAGINAPILDVIDVRDPKRDELEERWIKIFNYIKESSDFDLIVSFKNSEDLELQSWRSGGVRPASFRVRARKSGRYIDIHDFYSMFEGFELLDVIKSLTAKIKKEEMEVKRLVDSNYGLTGIYEDRKKSIDDQSRGPLKELQDELRAYEHQYNQMYKQNPELHSLGKG